MSTELRRTHQVLDVFRSLIAEGRSAAGLRAADIVDHLRALGQPMDAWQIRGELSNLEARGAIFVEPATGNWFLAEPTQDTPQLKDTA